MILGTITSQERVEMLQGVVHQVRSGKPLPPVVSAILRRPFGVCLGDPAHRDGADQIVPRAVSVRPSYGACRKRVDVFSAFLIHLQ